MWTQTGENEQAPAPLKRRRVVPRWHDEYFEVCPDGSRRCKLCPDTVYGHKTSSGTRLRHLEVAHKLTSESPLVERPSIEVRRYAPEPSLAVVVDNAAVDNATVDNGTVDNAVIKYIASAGLGHRHVESAGFAACLRVLRPSYTLMTASTVKQRLLEMYVVLKLMLIDYFAAVEGRFSCTLESSASSSGDYCLTLHWADPASIGLLSVPLDFFYVHPSLLNASEAIADAIYSTLGEFAVWRRLVAVVCDSSSMAAAKTLSTKPESTLLASCCLPCFAHTLDRGVHAVLAHFEDVLDRLRSMLVKIHASKQQRDAFRLASALEHEAPLTVPRLDSDAHWRSTHAMLTTALEAQGALAAVCNSVEWDGALDASEWARAKALCAFLDIPKDLALSMERAPSSLSLAILCQHAVDNYVVECAASDEPEMVVAANAMREATALHESLLASKAARIAAFLDVRLPKAPRGSTESVKELDFIQAILDDEYPTEASSSRTNLPRMAELFMRSFTDCQDTVSSELESFVNERRLKLAADLLEWWDDQSETYPRLYRMARDYLTIPSSKQTPSWQPPPSDNDTMDKAETCLTSWLHFLHHVSAPMPTDFHAAFERLDKTKVTALRRSDPIVAYLYRHEA